MKKKDVPMNSAAVPQHKRMAAGEKVDGKSVPSQPAKKGSKKS